MKQGEIVENVVTYLVGQIVDDGQSGLRLTGL